MTGSGAPPHANAWAHAQRVYLQGTGLPARWAERRHFVILEAGFGQGVNFLATWQAWRGDAQRCAHLHFVSVAHPPPSRDDMVAAHAQSPAPELAAELLKHWPPLTKDLHAVDFEDGRVRLLVAVGDNTAQLHTLLHTLRLAADAVFLCGAATGHAQAAWPPRLLKAVGRLAAPGARLASSHAAVDLQASLVTAGFAVGAAAAADSTPGTRCAPGPITLAQFAPRFVPHRLPSAAVPNAKHAVVVGAGLAGAATAQALVRLGLQVTVLEQHSGPAQEASGNPGGLFHGTLNADDGVYARLFRAAALHAARAYAPAIASGTVPGMVTGLLRLETTLADERAMQALLCKLGLPDAYVSARCRQAASHLAGVPLPGPAWFYPGGGWLSPAAWVQHALDTPGVHLRCGATTHAVVRDGHDWCAQDAQGRTLARAPVLVLANAAGATSVLALRGHGPWPLQRTRGQVTHWSEPNTPPLRLPVAGDGYALPLPGGLLCGATRQADDDDTTVRDADHRANLARLQRLTGLPGPSGATGMLGLTTPAGAVHGRVGWRLQADDRLPIAGPMPLVHMPPGQRLDQARLLPRESGLFVLTALGARGLTLAPLLARLVAAQATGTPWPVGQDLADAVDPARWRVRAARTQG